MTSKELIAATLKGQPGLRVPVGPLAVHFCARRAGCTLRQYSTDVRTLADSVIGYYERFKPDAVWVSADTWVSAEAMGARAGAADDNQPLGGLGEPLVRCAADIDRIPAPDVGGQGRYPLMLEALSRIVRELGREVFIVGCMDQYPFSLASALMGINEIMTRVADDPEFVRALMSRCVEYASAYGRALAAAGADMLSGGDSPVVLLGRKHYEEIAWPAEKQLISELKAATAIPVSLHNCGDAAKILALMAGTGADVLEIDSAVDLAAACRMVGPQIGLWGNLDPVAVLSQGTPEQVRHAAQEAIAAVRAAGHSRYVLSSGCTLAVETPAANLEALIGVSRT